MKSWGSEFSAPGLESRAASALKAFKEENSATEWSPELLTPSPNSLHTGGTFPPG